VDDGRAEDLEGLKATIREEIEAGYEQRSEVEVRRALTDQLVEVNPFELPAGFVDMQLRDEARRRLQPLIQQGLDPKMFSPDMLMDSIRPDFTQMMRRSFLLDAIADKESLEVTDEEVEAHIKENVEAQNQRQFADPRAREGLRQELRMEKAYQFIREQAKLEEVERDASWFDRDQQPADGGEGDEEAVEAAEAVEATEAPEAEAAEATEGEATEAASDESDQ
jgi:trigger factor